MGNKTVTPRLEYLLHQGVWARRKEHRRDIHRGPKGHRSRHIRNPIDDRLTSGLDADAEDPMIRQGAVAGR